MARIGQRVSTWRIRVADTGGRVATHTIKSGDRIIKQSGRALLVEMADGSKLCSCPYACLAAYEKCEFGEEKTA